MDYKLLSDNILGKLLSEEDEEAFREIYLRYWEKLYKSFLRKVQSKEVAEELVQNLFVQLWEKRRERVIENLENYLQVASKYLVFNFIRSKVMDAKYLEYAAIFFPQSSNTTETEVHINELSLALEAGLSQLPDKTQKIFKLNRLENYTVKEISEKLDIPSRTIEYHLHHALKSLRLYLKDFDLLLLLLFI